MNNHKQGLSAHSNRSEGSNQAEIAQWKSEPVSCLSPYFHKKDDALELRIPFDESERGLISEILTAFGGDEKWLAVLLADNISSFIEQIQDPISGAAYELCCDCGDSRDETLRALRHFEGIGWIGNGEAKRWERDNPPGKAPLSCMEGEAKKVETMIKQGHYGKEDLPALQRFVERFKRKE